MAEPIAPPQSDNHALRRIVGDLDEIIHILAGDYDVIEGGTTIEVGDTATLIRGALSTAVKTLVTNLEDTTVYIYENGLLVATLYLEETWVSDLRGNQIITGKCKNAGFATHVALTTYART